MLTKEEAKRLIDNSCKTRGEYISLIKKEIIRLGGKESVKKFEEEISKKIGSTFEFKKINDLDWYPTGLRTVCLIVLKDKFNLKDDDFIEMGIRAVGNSIVAKIFFKYFFSRETAFKYIPNDWRKVCTCGRLEPVELTQSNDGKRGRFIVRLHDFKFHPLVCKGFLGSFLQLAKLLGGKNAKIEETKCMHNGDPYHEFLITW